MAPVRVDRVRHGHRLRRARGCAVVQDDARFRALPRAMDRARESVVVVAPLTVARLRRALRRPPRYLVRRAIEAARHRTLRPWSRVYPRLLTERALLVLLGADDVDQLWAALAAQPFFIADDDRGRYASGPGSFVAQDRAFRDEVVRRADAVLRHEFD